MEFRDLKKQYFVLKEEIDSAVEEVLSEADFIFGKQTGELEKELADYIGVPACIVCANGTDALILALSVWGIGAGDAVFVPDFTFFASGEAAASVGAVPIFVDVEKDTFNIDCGALEQAVLTVINSGRLRPAAVIAVDLFGQPADYIRLSEIARKYHLRILEDGAQGFGGAFKGKKACSFGDIAATSFFPAKPLGCYGDGGALFVKKKEDEEMIRSLQAHGKGSGKYDNVRIGMNSRLDTIQAAILKVKLRAFRKYELERVNQIAEYYSDGFKEMVCVPVVRKGFYSSWAQYTIQLTSHVERKELQEYLKQNQIPSAVYYPRPMHKQPAFQEYFSFYKEENYEITNQLCSTVLSLPLYPYMEDSEIEKVVRTVQKFFLVRECKR